LVAKNKKEGGEDKKTREGGVITFSLRKEGLIRYGDFEIEDFLHLAIEFATIQTGLISKRGTLVTTENQQVSILHYLLKITLAESTAISSRLPLNYCPLIFKVK